MSRTPPASNHSHAAERYVLFAFDGPGHDGLDLYASAEGLAWRTLATRIPMPVVSTRAHFRDPHATVTPDGVIHLAWTTDPEGFAYARSTDGVHWTDARFVRVTDPARDLDFTNVWAPFIHHEDGLFTIIWSSTLRRDYVPPADPAKWWTAKRDNRFYYTTTRDWKTFTPAERFWSPDFNVIDAKIHRAAPGDYRIIFKDERKGVCQIAVGRAPALHGPYTDVRLVTEGPFCEGPILLQRGPADHLLYFDDYADAGPGYSVRATADLHTFGPVQKLALDASARRPHHGSIVQLAPEQIAHIARSVAATPAAV